MSLWETLDQDESETLAKLRELDRQRDPLLAHLADIRTAKAALRPNELPLLKLADAATAQFYEALTLKQLAIRALRDHFADGATTHQLLVHFERAYGRRVERPSLSPQLSRLKDDREIVLDGRLWKLAEPDQKRNEPPAREAGGSLVSDDGVSAPRSSPVLKSRQ
jgi:hypothetical protein